MYRRAPPAMHDDCAAAAREESRMTAPLLGGGAVGIPLEALRFVGARREDLLQEGRVPSDETFELLQERLELTGAGALDVPRHDCEGVSCPLPAIADPGASPSCSISLPLVATATLPLGALVEADVLGHLRRGLRKSPAPPRCANRHAWTAGSSPTASRSMTSPPSRAATTTSTSTTTDSCRSSAPSAPRRRLAPCPSGTPPPPPRELGRPTPAT
mmetsp:Transcript_86142/g.239750  ORF Transcript_86142/g.239750 Transcript_86142/m.239750 type:complete len:215 (+) Transcript_86142:396-1040(+)